MSAGLFTCGACGQVAGEITLDDGELRRESFTSVLTQKLDADATERVRRALAKGARALYELDLEYAPFFCPECETSYCGDHWQRWDVFEGDWHDSIQGRCPRGHERMLED